MTQDPGQQGARNALLAQAFAPLSHSHLNRSGLAAEIAAFPMANIPDQFDLFVRRARRETDPEQQMEILMGALLARADWYFINIGTPEIPEPARAELEGGPHLLVFSSSDKLHNMRDLRDDPTNDNAAPFPNFSIPCMKAVEYCLSVGDAQLGPTPGGKGKESAGDAKPGISLIEGLLVNPGDYAFAISMAQFRHYITAWKERGGHLGQGFIIPNMSTEEDDFYQEHGL